MYIVGSLVSNHFSSVAKPVSFNSGLQLTMIKLPTGPLLLMLQATAVIERIRRAISETSDAVNARLQPISSAFGKAFKVDDWAVELFAEEVVRGGPAFAVSLILSAMEPGFRAAAELGAWQLISPVNVTGKVVVVANLHEVQDKVSLCCFRPCVQSSATLSC